eukprot:5829756-Prymnesium_polylepis.1
MWVADTATRSPRLTTAVLSQSIEMNPCLETRRTYTASSGRATFQCSSFALLMDDEYSGAQVVRLLSRHRTDG